MLLTNKKNLDSLASKERVKSFLYKFWFLFGCIAVIWVGNSFYENKQKNYKKLEKISFYGIFKSGAQSKSVKFCFFELPTKK